MDDGCGLIRGIETADARSCSGDELNLGTVREPTNRGKNRGHEVANSKGRSFFLFWSFEGVDKGEAFMLSVYSGDKNVIENFGVNGEVYFGVKVAPHMRTKRAMKSHDLESEDLISGWVLETIWRAFEDRVSSFC